MSQFIPDIRQGGAYHLKIEYPHGTNITGFKFWLTLKRRFADLDNAAVFQKVITVTENADSLIGVEWFSLSAQETSQVPVGEYVWDLKGKSPTDDPQTLLPPLEYFDDKIKVTPTATRALS